MTLADLPAVQAIERESFTTPWPPHAYRTELETNRLAHYIVARSDREVIGFAGMWLMVDEAHITTFAVRSDWRRQGVGERLLLALIDLARARGAHEATLEVRPSNTPARRLYEKYGFRPVGIRPRYYSDNNEDALIMTTEALESRPMRARIDRLRASLLERIDGPAEPPAEETPDPSVEPEPGTGPGAESGDAAEGDDTPGSLPVLRRRITRRRP